jgi:hypothetical protein
MIMSVDGGEPRPVAGLTAGNLTWSRASDTLLVARPATGDLFRVDTSGRAPEPLPRFPASPYILRALPDGRSILYSVITGPIEDRQIWRGTLADGQASRVTHLTGRRGDLSENFTTDGKYLYFIWREDDGDIWTMDVAR